MAWNGAIRAGVCRVQHAIWRRLVVMRGGDVYWEERQILYAAHGALVRAGTVVDRHARRLVSAAVGVLGEWRPGSLATADAVRCPGNYASSSLGCQHRPGACGALVDPPRGSAKTALGPVRPRCRVGLRGGGDGRYVGQPGTDPVGKSLSVEGTQTSLATTRILNTPAGLSSSLRYRSSRS